jgi:peptide/nickel transport system substrate-binding protein
MKKLWMVLFVLLLALGVGFVSLAGAVPKGTLRVAEPDFSYESMDPIFWESFWGWAMYDPLLTFDAKGNAIGSVAESYTLSPDGKTWTFKIRKGMKFHNGDPVTSADVAFSVVRFSSKESTNPWSPYLRNNFDTVETPDDYTFVYHSTRPDPYLIVPFEWTRILPKNYIEKNGVDYFRKHPVGSGPWKFVKHISKTSMEMEANTEHWRRVPYWERVIDLMVPEEATRVAMLKNGEIDIATELTYDRVAELRDLGFGLQEAGFPTLNNISFQATWLTDGPTKDKRIRMAMSYAINRQEMCDTIYRGFGKPGGRWFMDENTYGWDPSWKPDPYDPARAKALLNEAGYPEKYEGKVVNIFTQAVPGQFDMSQAVAGYWEEIGIKTKITTVDPMTYGGYFFVRIKDPNAPNVGAVIPWSFQGVHNNVYHSANMFKSTGVHSTGNDPKADALYDEATSELDPVKAKRLWTEFMEYGYNMWVNVGVVRVPTYVLVGPRVGKWTSNSHMSWQDALAGIQHK